MFGILIWCLRFKETLRSFGGGKIGSDFLCLKKILITTTTNKSRSKTQKSLFHRFNTNKRCVSSFPLPVSFDPSSNRYGLGIIWQVSVSNCLWPQCKLPSYMRERSVLYLSSYHATINRWPCSHSCTINLKTQSSL